MNRPMLDGELQQCEMRFPENYLYRPTYDLPRGITPDFFIYQFPVVNQLAVDANVTVSVQIQNDADFECRAITYFYNLLDAAFVEATRPVPNWTLMLTESGSGRNLFSAAVPVVSVASNGEAVLRDLAWPKIFGKNSVITATFVNFDAAVTTGQMYLSLVGRKLFSGFPR